MLPPITKAREMTNPNDSQLEAYPDDDEIAKPQPDDPEAWRDMSEALFSDASAKADATERRGYLGDDVVVETLLRNAISWVMNDMEEPEQVRLASLRNAATSVAKVLLGMDRKYAAVRRWNEPGAIDAFAAKWCGSAETDPMERLAHCFLAMMNELFALADYVATPGVLAEQWKWQVDAIVQRYVAIFLGIPPHQQAIM